VDVLGVQNTKSYELLTALKEKRLIIRKGQGRGTYYVLKGASDE
jgi:hypothetical protein